jgi:hypothetical protein
VPIGERGDRGVAQLFEPGERVPAERRERLREAHGLDHGRRRGRERVAAEEPRRLDEPRGRRAAAVIEQVLIPAR